MQYWALEYPNCYSHNIIGMVRDVQCYTKPGNHPSQWKIALPKGMILSTIKWYVTGHLGHKRLYQQLSQRYYHHDLRESDDKLNCEFIREIS